MQLADKGNAQEFQFRTAPVGYFPIIVSLCRFYNSDLFIGARRRAANCRGPVEILFQVTQLFGLCRYQRRGAHRVVIGRLSPTYTTQGGSKVTVTGNAVVQTVFMEIFGINTVRISSTSPTSWGFARLRIALVLDVTGSRSWVRWELCDPLNGNCSKYG